MQRVDTGVCLVPTGLALVVAVDFEKGIVWIKWIGTHKDDDRIDARELKYDA